jgi:hypothetical protein
MQQQVGECRDVDVAQRLDRRWPGAQAGHVTGRAADRRESSAIVRRRVAVGAAEDVGAHESVARARSSLISAPTMDPTVTSKGNGTPAGGCSAPAMVLVTPISF